MSNQLLQWAFFIVLWFSLFLMKKETVKRFFPVALMSALTSILIYEVGISYRWWTVKEMTIPSTSCLFTSACFPF